MKAENKQYFFKEITWAQARQQVYRSDPEFAQMLDELSPDNTPLFIQVRYPFGAKIYHNGSVHLPVTTTHTVPLHDTAVPQQIKEHLSYGDLPLGLINNQHGVEVHRELDDRVFSLAFFSKGLDVGIWETFAPATPFTLTAGARSIFLLPKIADSASHKRLKSLGVYSLPPHTLFEHWKIFTELANHPDFSDPWHCEILFLIAHWAKKIKTDPAWLKIYNFILRKAWGHTRYGRNKIMFDIVWEAFSRMLSSKKIRPTSYVVDTLKHLVFVANGTLPAFTPAVNDIAGPALAIQKIYLEHYGLKTYFPTIMHPHHFSLEKSSDCVYYSLQVPTQMDSVPKSRNSVSTKIDLSEFIWLIEKFKLFLENNPLPLDNYQVYDILTKVQFDFFHSESDVSQNIQSTEKMIIQDQTISHQLLPNDPRKFAEKSTFVRGCIRISSKKL